MHFKQLNISSIIICCFLFSTTVFAQKINANQQCGYDYLVSSMEEKYPGFKETSDLTFRLAKEYKSSNLRNEIMTIPVVVHIVYQNQEQNISDVRIKKVIKRLNEDYRHTNENRNNIRPEFKSIIGDPMIRFELKEIIRKSTTKKFKFNILFGTFPDYVKTDSGGGSNAKDTKKFLNIWVCNIEGGALLGYAYPPTCAPNWPDGVHAPKPFQEGVVIHHKAFNTDATYFVQGRAIHIDGRTLTHEVGHFLGLRHIWGDGLSASIGIPDCKADDGIADTPNQGLPSQNTCSKFQNSCTDSGGGDKPDMIENYMDYADELCMSAFTNDQITIMRNILKTCRKELVVTTNATINQSQRELSTIYPNPTNGIIHVQNNHQNVPIVSFEFYNNMGQKVSPINKDYDQSYFDFSTFKKGIYYVKINYKTQSEVIKIVLIQ